MIPLSKRSELILNTLVSTAKNAVSGNELAEIFKVSSRSIRNSIREINEAIAEVDCAIASSAKGYYLDQKAKEKLRLYLSPGNTKEFLPSSQDERFIYLTLRILFADRSITYDELAEETFYSRATVIADFSKIEKFLKKYSLTVNARKGIIVTGKESNRRIATASLMVKSFTDNFDYLQRLLPEIVGFDDTLFYKVYDFLIQTLNENRVVLTDKDLIIFTYEVIVSVLRSKEGHSIEADFHPRNDSLISISYEDLGKIFATNISMQDRYYIDNCFSYKRMLSSDRTSADVASEVTETIIKQYFEELMNEYNIDLNNNETLKKNLANHINSLIKRSQYETEEDYYLTKDIKEKYAYSFELATVIVPIMHKYLGIELSESELAYIAIHLALIIDNKTSDLKTIVICGSGYSTAQLAISRLNRIFGERVDVLAYGPSYLAEQLIKENPQTDVLISTVPISQSLNKPVINVSPLISEDDVKKIEGFFQYKQTSVYANPDLPFNKNLFFVFEEGKDKHSILRTMTYKLYELGYIKSFPEFYGSVLQREKLYSTVYEKVWLPHPMRCMSKTTVAAVGIVKNNDSFKLVILAAINAREKEKYQTLYAKIGQLLSDKDKLEEVCMSESFAQISKVFQEL